MYGSGGGGGEEDVASRRRKDLLAEARRKRLNWIDSEDPTALISDHLKAHGGRPGRGVEQRRQTTVSALMEETPGLEAVMASAKDYVAFLNGLLEEDPEKVEYIIAPLSRKEADGEEEVAVPRYEPGVPVYEVFLKKLKHPSSADVVKAMQRFVSQFLERQRSTKPIGLADSNAPADSLHGFLQSIETEMRKSLAWKQDGALHWEETRECLERFMMIKLHPYFFTMPEKEELIKRDAALNERLAALSFLGPQNLDVKSLSSLSVEETARALKPAVKDLRRISKVKAPKDMIECVMACSKTLTRTLIELHADGTLPGADEFLPALILVVQQANPKGLHSAIETIQRYRHPSKLVSEAGYIFTHLVSAVHFLENADASQLTISPEDLERLLAEHQAKSRARVATLHLDDDDDASQSTTTSSALPPDQDRDPLSLSTSGNGLPPPSTNGHAAGVAFTPCSIHQVRKARMVGVVSEGLTSRSTSSNNSAISMDTSSGHSSRNPDLRRSPWDQASPSKAPTSVRAMLEKVRSSGVANSFDLGDEVDTKVSQVSGLCRYYHCTPDNVKLSDVPAILGEYRDLAALCDELLARREVTLQGFSSSGYLTTPS